MRPALRLAINNLSGRRSRTLLLIASVALSAGLIAAVACAMASVERGIKTRVEETVGVADAQIEDIGRKSFDASLLEKVDRWPEIAIAVGRAKEAVALKPVGGGEAKPIETWGLMPDREYKIRPPRLREGRPVEGDGEIVLDAALAKDLNAKVGSVVGVERFGDPISLTVVGILKPPAFANYLRPEAYVSVKQLGAIAELRGRLRQVDLIVKPGEDPEKLFATHADDLPRGLVIRVSSKVSSGLEKNIQASRIGMIIASALAFLSAAFIIMTGLTTNVSERLRELAVLRCIGGTRLQLAEGQLWVGFIIGVCGAAAGIPFGVVGAATLVAVFPEQLPSGFSMSWFGAVLALVGAVLSGAAGAAWPAWRASRATPLEALSARARQARPRNIAIVGVIGLALAATHASILAFIGDAQVKFWTDVSIGLPALFTGYFLLSVPICCVVTLAAAGLVGRLFDLPRGLLGRTVLATPYRHGFTSGAMMVGLALLIAIWTNGRSIMKDWLEGFAFPDAFVNGLNLSPQTQEAIDKIPGVTETCAITTQVVKTDAFGIKALSPPSTTFVAFQPERFFRMTKLEWVQPTDAGGQERAKRRLEEGGAVLVAREFLVAKKMGVGQNITLTHENKPYPFEIVGVVSSPGLDIVSQFFDIGDQYLDNAVNAVFGSRADLKARFGNDAINLIQISIDPKVDDALVMKEVRKLVGVGVISAGSGREVKAEISKVLRGSLLVMSVVAIGAMLVSCFGVANLIVAGIQARQFEFGVLRSIGAQRGQVGRLVLGEAVIVGLTACVVGTMLGVQAAWGGQQINQALIGLVLKLRPQPSVIGAGWLAVLAITLGAAAPAVWRLTRQRPRELLGAMKG